MALADPSHCPDDQDSLLVVDLALAADPPVCAVCGHAQDAHEHYRPGTDCALCDCPRFRRKR
ncbi:hypothetical protein ACTJKO_14485 [Curtobacterium sp. 22159]|uniref:hypothetical protein n=1 Tax=Curtobacterium sp. 22159 TaxID=3453882 RepID=UPI003F833C40